ncbi:fused response regulator/thioredoxin-disulfide reductase [Marivirga lumbricoides]|uniref:Fused response regulator/thioredoxin-disulfide reductase n=1 Tax=Marivirga lumbricoides TaxID=1046115 RepID=A0ABQ1LM56_9BACT|nr:fused response regulator/thioredoxin-disulfide reductase [Marivirga lumbricoides]
MSLAIIFSIDDDPQVLRAITRDLKSKYRSEYRVLSTTSAREALDSLLELKNQGETVALFLSDNRMPEMMGVDFLEKARGIFPLAKRVLLTAYSDTEAAIKAINEVQLDYYLLKPWDPPTEKLYPVIDDLLEEWEQIYVPDYKGLKVIGYQFSPKSHQLKDFLSGNLFPFKWMDIQTNEEAQSLLSLNNIENSQLPAVFLEDGEFLLQPSAEKLGAALGLNTQASSDLYDTVIIGAGPSGLAAAVYAASEGLKTLLIDKRAPGGQAGTSSRIENYLGFPNGLSGAELARRAITQATRFGTEFLSPKEVSAVEFNDPYKTIILTTGEQINAKSIVVTTGVNYRQLEAPGIEKLLGAGIYYGAANTEASFCTDKSVMIVGGGNSAGQAAMYLSQYASEVVILIRKKGLEESMSSYLIEQINNTPNIKLWTEGEVKEVIGEEKLEKISVVFKNGESREVEAAALFIFIGAKAVTEWLPESVVKDKRNYVITGVDLKHYPQFKKIWKLPRDPYLLETSIPGVFSGGDVRSGAMNRVASAVGEGAMTISMVHKYLAEI